MCKCACKCVFFCFFFIFRSVCILSILSHLCTSKHPPLIFTKSPRLYKVFLSAWSSVWMKVTKLTSLFLKKGKKKYHSSFGILFLECQILVKSVCFFLFLKNSLKIGFIVGCCFRVVFFFLFVFFFVFFFSNCFLVVAAVVLVAKFPYIIGRGCPGLVLQYWGLWE